jgi:hypothetical protein
MVERVKQWLTEGKYDVRIFTARVSSSDEQEVAAVEDAIESWCKEHIGQALPVTCKKDNQMVQLWDDRAMQVVPNTGESVQELLEASA